MATDGNTPSNALDRDSSTHNDSIFTADEQDSVFDAVQLAQAEGTAPAVQAAAPTGVPGAPQQVAIPAGADVVRVPVQPGDVLVLGAPFTGGAEVIGRIGDGNLAIKVGEVTVILQGYVDANQQAPVTVETADGQPIDVATMLASTDPAIDIQTAAGPGDAAAGAQGADNNGALFSQFGPGGGLGGFTGVGAQDQTELSYGLIDASIRNDFADPVLGTGVTFGIAVGPLSGGHSERFLRDPAQTTPLGSFADFMTEYQDAVENHENPMFPGWADFQGTGATSGDFEEYLQQTRRTIDVDATFTGATGALVLNGIVAGITSNGSTLHADSADQGQTLFVRRDSDNALVAVIHVEPTDTGFTIDTYMINRIDHPDAGTGDAGRDEMVIGIEFTVYDGPSPYQQEGEGTTPSPSLEGTAEFTFADDVPLFDNVTYHNLDGAPGDDGITDSASKGLIDEDWLQTGANDKGADGNSNAGANDDTHGSFYVNGQININFGADGSAQTDNPKDEAADKHAFALDIGGYTQGEVFHYGEGTLSSGGQTLYVLAVSESQLIVGIPAPEVEGEDGSEELVAIDAFLGTPIFSLALNQATGAFTFTLFGPLDHTSELFFGDPEDTIPLAFNVTATDDDGDTVPATINIDVNDDIPVARDDSDNLPAGTYGPEGGNVMSGIGTEFPATGTDNQGADSAIVTKLGGFGGSVDNDSSNGLSVAGKYGTLQMSESGEYTYTRDPKTPGGVSDVFTYTLTDKDGDTSTATLTVKIGNADVTVDTPSGRDGTIVFEHGLPERNGTEPAGSGENGSNNDDPSEAANGVVTITAKDGIDTLQVGSNPALTLAQLNDLTANPITYSDPTGALKLTGFDEGTGKLSYTYTLLDNTTDDPDSVSFDIKVTDIDGSDATGTLAIQIVDDEPTANDDTDALDNVTQTASGNVITGTDTTSSGADIQGADTAKVTGASSATGGDQPADINGDTTVAGKYGTLQIAANGEYTYTRADSAPLTDTDTFTYTLEDADGDKSTATLTISISDTGVEITNLTSKTDGGDVTVDEDDLSDGSDTTPESTTAGGTFTISAPDGVNDLTIGGQAIITGGVFTATSFTTPLGNTLAVTGYNAGTGEITYSYTLNDNTTHSAAGQDSKFEDFAVVLKDVDGDTANSTLSAKIVDDVPTANDDTDALDNATQTASGNVITGADTTSSGADIQGADTAKVTGASSTTGGDLSADINGDTTIAGKYGTLQISANGEYTYTRADSTPLTDTDTFTYTLEDADGDKSTATLTISISDKGVQILDLTPSASGGDVTVDEDDLSNGSDTSKEPTIGLGTFKIDAPDGVLDVSIAGTKVIDGGALTANLTIATPLGNTLTVTGYDSGTGVISYSYTLNDNTTTHSSASGEDSVFENLAVVLHDVDGDEATGTLSAAIVDDVPTANPDTDALDNVTQTASGNVITGTDTTSSGADIQGADTAKVTGASSATGGDQPADINGDTTVAGKYGTLQMSANGDYTYTRADSTPLTDTDTFTYTLEDADGDKSTATLTISITDKGVTITDLTPDTGGGDVTVDEDDLADGSDTTKESTTGAGTFTISAPDGVDEVSIAGTKVIDNGALTANLVITTPLGNTLTVTGYDSGTGVISYSYTLNDNTTTHSAATGEDSVFENLAVTLTDVDGDTANATLSAKIVDDVPTANPDTDSLNNVTQTATGNVISGTGTSSGVTGVDVEGADGATVTKLEGFVTTDGDNSDGLSVTGKYGTLQMSANGEYTYTRTNSTPLTDTDTFTYTLEDADGDTSTATLTISISDKGVTITDLTPDTGGGDVTVDEDDLSDGSDTTKESTTGTGTFTISAPDGVDEVSIAGTKVIDNGALTANLVIATPLGNTLTVTGYDSGTGVISYSYTLNDNTTTHSAASSEDSVFENLAVVLHDVDGDEATGTLSAAIVDDVPTAKDDTDSVGNLATTSGNVITGANTSSGAAGADVPGADGATVTKLEGSNSSDSTNSDGLTAVGTYGTLTMSANGEYTYTRSGTAPLTDTDSFTYTLEDADGDKSTATLTISINDQDVTISNLTPSASGGDVSVDEDDLADGSDSTKESTTATGSFTISAPDGVDEVTIAGVKVIDNGALTATLTITTPLGNALTVTDYTAGVISYTYTLNDNTTSHSSASGEDGVFENLAVVLTDVDGDTANATLSAGIVDDVPTAHNDTDSLDNVANTASGNVITGSNTSSGAAGADVPGADGASIAKLEGSKSSDSDSSGGFTAVGTYGTLQMAANGEYTYTRSGTAPLTDTDTFTYTLEDADGDKSTATLIVSINDQDVTISNLTPSANGGDVSVDEDDLADGSDTTKESTTATGTFTVSAPDGVDEVSIAGTKVIDNGALTANLTITTPLGNTLTVTGYDSGTGVISYSYKLNDNTTTHSSASGEDSVFENLAVTLTDVDGDTANGTLSAKIVDDVPTANPDTDSLNNVTQTASGNVISGVGTTSSGADVPGADGATVTKLVGSSTTDSDNSNDLVAVGTYGTLQMAANGEYTYTRSGNTPLTDTDTFTYTLEDADGDKSTATLTISITDKGVTISDLTPSANGGDVSVDEDDLADGSDSAKESTTGTGSFKIDASDGVDEVSIAGTKVIDNGALTANLTIATPLGNTLTVTGYDSGTGVISYSYTLNDNTTTHSSVSGEDSVFENLAVTLTDVDGDTANATLSAGIVDDVPTASPDTDSLDNVTQTAGGNVISGLGTTSSGADVPGADGATVTKLVGSSTTDSDNSNGLTAVGTYGTLSMSANGQYTYTRSGSTPLTDTDTFTYTLEDADGDKSTATLTINIKDQDVTITNLTPSGSGGDVSVDEDDLSASRGIGESAGSDSTPDSTTASGDFKITAPDGVDEVSIAGIKVIDNGALTANLTVTTPLGNTLTVTGYDSGTGVISYSYTLKDNTTTHSAATGEDSVFENLAVTLTDVDGDQTTGTLSAKIVDDVPTAFADAKSVNAGGSVGDNVESNDVFGADGADSLGGVVGVVKGTNTSLPVSGNINGPIAGDFGTLTLNANGTYTYQALANVSGVDHFVYTIKDGDGDLSTTKLDITVNNVVLKTETQTVTVYESALDKIQDPGDLVAGTVIGSDPSSSKETVTGTLTFDPGVTTVTKDYTGTYGTLHVDSTGAFTYTLSTNKIGSPAANDGANTYLAAESFSIQIKDGGGNTGTDTIKVNVVDDTPLAYDPQNQSLLNAAPGGVITGKLDLAGHTGADGMAATNPVVFSGGTDGSFAKLVDGTTSMLYQTHNIILTGFGTTTLTGTADINNSGTIDAGDTQVFTVTLDAAKDQFAFNLLKPIDNGAKIDFTDLSNAKAGNGSWLGVGADAGDATTRDLLYTAKTAGQSINSSNTDVATGNQWIDPGEGLRLDFVKGLTTGGGGADPYNFASHYQVQDFQISVADIQGNANSTTTIKLTAFDVTNNLVNDATTTSAQFLAEGLVALSAGELTILRGGVPIASGTNGILVTFDASGFATISGLKAHDVIQIDESTGFDRLLIEPGTADANLFAMTGAKVLNTSIGFDIDAKFETTLTDGDGDKSKGSIDVNLQTNDGESHTFKDGPGNDTLQGGSGNDLIFGDAGNDTMLYDSKDTFNGGADFDRVLVTTGNTSIASFDPAKFIGIEMIDLGDHADYNRTGSGNQNTLSLSAADVVTANGSTVAASISGATPNHQINLFVIGDTNGTSADKDNVHLTGFTKIDSVASYTDPVTGAAHAYDIYQSSSGPVVKVAVEASLDIV